MSEWSKCAMINVWLAENDCLAKKVPGTFPLLLGTPLGHQRAALSAALDARH